jgi:hypothetical protein
MMPEIRATSSDIDPLDRFNREGGLRSLAPPQVHYDHPECPHPGCAHRMEWIDFKLELAGDSERVYKPLVRAWWEGTGFAGRCPNCHGWIRFTTLGMEVLTPNAADSYLHLPDDWHTIAQFA